MTATVIPKVKATDAMPNAVLTCWVLTDGRASMRNQCVGLAGAMGLTPEEKTVRPRAPWKWLPPRLWPAPLSAPGAGSDRITPPWPDLLIACGQKMAALSMAVRRAAKGRTFTVQIESPGMNPGHFDLVVAPRHDRLSGDNVLSTRGALNRITAELLEAEAKPFPALSALPRPLVAVMVGGDNRCYALTPAAAHAMCDGLEQLLDQGCGMVVTVSRRTGAEAEAVIRRRLNRQGVDIWDGRGPNPYFAYLALADHLVVTADSVAMVSEAATTGKPVHVVDLPRKGAARSGEKFRRFHHALMEEGVTRRFTGALDEWDYPPLNDAATVAAEVWRRIESSRARPTGA